MENKIVKCGNLSISNNSPFTLIAGPCQLENEKHAISVAEKLKEITEKLKIGFIYKTSFDKGNRTSLDSSRGLGMELGLPILADLRAKFNCPVLTDVHTAEQCNPVAEVVDVLQIPAFLCRQTDLLIAAARTQRVVNVKKGQFLAPWDMKSVAQKIAQTGNEKILLCERGASFGYNTLVSDMRSLSVLSEQGYPVVFDATHSVQQPGGKGDRSGGERQYVPLLARAAVAAGVAAIFIETHEDPDNAPSDGPNMVPLKNLEKLLSSLIAIDRITKDTLYRLGK